MPSPETSARISRFVSRLYGRLFSANPYPLYKFLRTRYPLLRTPIGFWISTRYADCHSVLRDKRFLAFDLNALDAFPPDDGLKSMREALQHAIVFRNPPDHTRLRRLMTTFFSPGVVNGLQPRIQKIVDYLLDAVEARRSMDLIKDVAFPFPIDVLAEVMGADDVDKPMFRDWMRTLGVPLDPVISANDPGVEVRQAIADVRRYFSGLAADRRKHPREDLISIMVSAENRGDLQTEEELVFSAMFTLLAGHETTMNMIGNGMLALFRNPEALARLRSDSSLIEPALDEFLRFDSPVQVTFRTASEDIELAGRTIPRGDHVVVFLGAANRDPLRFAYPDKLEMAPRHEPSRPRVPAADVLALQIDAYTASIRAVARGSISKLACILFIVYPKPIFASGSAYPSEPPAPGCPNDFAFGPNSAPGCDIMKPCEKRVLIVSTASGPFDCSIEHFATSSFDITRTPSSSPPRASAPYNLASAPAVPCPFAAGISAARHSREFTSPGLPINGGFINALATTDSGFFIASAKMFGSPGPDGGDGIKPATRASCFASRPI